MSTLARNTTGMSRLVWTAGIVVGSCLPHWFNLPVWIRGLLLLAVGWRFAARIFHWPLPGRKTMWLVTIACFAGVLFEFNTINGLGPGTALLVVMVSLKFLEARSQRDYALLTVIAYFLVFASLLVGGGVIKGLYLVGFVWITTLGLLQVGRQGSLLPNVPTGKLAGRLLLQSLPLMIALFILFPRWTGPLWALPGDTSSGATGLAGSMSPGDITDLALSDEIAFRVEFDGQTPAASELYWRGPVLSKFDGRTWDQFDGMRAAGQRTIEYNGETSNYVVKLDSVKNGWLFALEMPQAWDNLSGRLGIRMDSDFQLRVGGFGGSAARINYSVTSHSNFRAMEAMSGDAAESFRRLPTDGNPRTRALVDSFLEDSPDTDTIVARALDVFREEGFFYTLTPPPLGEHTADEFIFDTQEGFCEHYASAFAIMMRMAGVPTRIVTGYQGGELNSMGDYYIIRQSDAHAWTEIWTAERGWYRVDPIQAVAPERIAFGSQRMSFQGERTIAAQIGRMRWLRRAALAWDAANNFWDDWVIGYGPRLQRTLLEWFGFDRPRWRELLVMTVAAAVLLTLVLAGYLSLRARRLNARDPAARSFEKFARRLRQLNVAPMSDGETPSAYGRRAAAALPERAVPIREITASYLQARYEPDWKGEALAGLKARVNAFSRGYARASR